MLILALHISSTPHFNLVQLLVQDLLLQSFLKVTTSLEDVESICIKMKILKTLVNWFIFFKTFYTIYFCDILVR